MAEDTAQNQQKRVIGKPFQPGQSGNPAGRPKGARSVLQEAFFKALAKDFEVHGEQAIVAMRDEKPAEYVRAIAGLMSKEITGEDGKALFPDEVVWRRASPRA